MTIDQEPAAEPVAPDDDGDVIVRHVHSRSSRWMHWINFPLLMIMIWSGLRIYNANDVYGIDLLGVQFDFFPQGVYDFLEADRRLAKGLAFHLTFGWLFAINGLFYGLHLWRSGEWRDIFPDRKALREVPDVVAHDLHLRSDEVPQGRYNAAQQLTYSAVIAMGALIIVSGFAIYKPTQLAPLTWLLGGYETARLIHFVTTLGFVAFFVLHIVQVARAGWGNLTSMITGYRVERVGPAGPLDDDFRPAADASVADDEEELVR